MPQNALAATIAVNPSGAQAPAHIGPAGDLLISGGGSKTALNQTAAAVIKTGAGRLSKLIVLAPGSTSGAFTLNDCATTGAAAAANELYTLLYNGTANVAGAVITLDLPFTTGLVLSAVPGAGSPICVISYT